MLYSSVCGCLFFFINSIDNNIIGTNSLRKFFTNFYPKSDTRIEFHPVLNITLQRVENQCIRDIVWKWAKVFKDLFIVEIQIHFINFLKV